MKHHAEHGHHHRHGESEVTPQISYVDGVITIELKDKNNHAPELEISHEKEMHLLVMSADLAEYHHGHPTKQSDGVYTLNKQLTENDYKIYVDIAPKKLNYSVSSIELRVGEPYKEHANNTLVVDTNFVQTINGYTVELTPHSFEVGKEISLKFDLKGSIPEPYLGALGHVVILDESGEIFIHVHPTANDKTIFDAVFTEPGIYKLWAEFQFEGQVNAYSFVIEAK